MTIKEMEAKLTHEGLLEAHVGMSLKKYVNGELIYRDSKWDNFMWMHSEYVREKMEDIASL